MGLRRVIGEPRGDADRRHGQEHGPGPPQRAPRTTQHDPDEPWGRRERQVDLLDEEAEGEDDAGRERPPERPALDGDDGDDEERHEERAGGHVQARGPAQVVEVDEGEQAGRGHRPDDRPDPPAEDARERHHRDARRSR